VIIELEDEFGIEIPDAEAEKIQSMNPTIDCTPLSCLAAARSVWVQYGVAGPISFIATVCLVFRGWLLLLIFEVCFDLVRIFSFASCLASLISLLFCTLVSQITGDLMMLRVTADVTRETR